MADTKYPRVGGTVRFMFTTHAAAGGAVAPSSAFEAADVILYKNGSATQRTSQAGWTMTSPFDSIVGLHQIEMDLSENTDAGFYAVGAEYDVVLSPDTETIDSKTEVRVIGSFRIVPAETIAGQPKVDVASLLGTAWLTPGTAGTPDVNVKLWNALATVALPLVPTTAGRTLAVDASQRALADVDTIKTNPVVNGGTITFPTNKTLADTTSAVGSVTGAVGSVTGLTASDVGAIKLKTDTIPAAPASTTNITGGTITTVTNLTNAPTSGDLTATMKASVTTAATNRVQKNTALAGFPFLMVDSTDHVTPKTGLTITATRSLDGAAFGACSNSASEVSAGVYKIDLAAGDTNGNTVMLKFTSAGADARYILIATQPT